MTKRLIIASTVVTLASLTISQGANAQESDAELAAKLSNPVSAMISVPVQANYDCCYGPSDGERFTVNFQPVIPVSINDDWNVIIRTVVPFIYQQSTAPGVDATYGVSDVTQSFFFSPKETAGGVTWAVGPVFLWPIGTDELGSQKWAAGPTGLILKKQGQATFGLLANHLWSYAGADDRDDLSRTFLQPFYSYTTASATTWGANLEATYDWQGKAWSVPLNLSVSQLYNFGGQRVSLGIGARLYLVDEGDSPDWGLRATATFLFPK